MAYKFSLAGTQSLAKLRYSLSNEFVHVTDLANELTENRLAGLSRTVMTAHPYNINATSQLVCGLQRFLSAHVRATTAKLGRKFERPILS